MGESPQKVLQPRGWKSIGPVNAEDNAPKKVAGTDMWDKIYESALPALSKYPPPAKRPETRAIPAPYYIGESVLWNDRELSWRQYSCVAEQRCEVVILALPDIINVL